MKYPKNKLFEKLASIEHERWASWQKYVHAKCIYDNGTLIIPKDLVNRWTRQLRNRYEDLSEEEKDSDGDAVMSYWDLINK